MPWRLLEWKPSQKYEAVIFYYKKSEVQGTTFLAKSQGQKKV